MNILFIATECLPFCRAGGLAHVVPGLARELCSQGHDVRIAIPCYQGLLDPGNMKEIVSGLDISLGTYFRKAHIWESRREPFKTYLIQNDFYFERDH
ncbi:MAG: hypothetical protein GY862_00680 [Gammaproteobacteria bacterium]|nr:hypothetical protein [Gammaproteobacteria bacterium]